MAAVSVNSAFYDVQRFHGDQFLGNLDPFELHKDNFARKLTSFGPILASRLHNELHSSGHLR